MCGIYGLLSPSPDPSLLDPMAARLHHRGPDHHGRFLAPGAALGNCRLAIMDPGHGNQPLISDDGALILVYNGELYNHPQLRAELEARGEVFRGNSDSETVLRALAVWGVACVARFNGMFALALWDQRRRRLLLARDRLGIKPLYMLSLASGGLAFASEPKALLHLLPGGPRPDWPALRHYFALGYFPPLESPFAGISQLPAGHWVQCDAGETPHATPYAELPFGQATTVPTNLRELVEQRLSQAVEMELMSDVPVGVLLSGGLDSSAVAHFAAACHRGPLLAFALRFAERTHDESADAALVARHLGLEYRELDFTQELLEESLTAVAATLDAPFGDSTVLPLWALSRFAATEVKVVLTGWGGDEVFAGYPTYRAHQLARLYRRAPHWLAQRLIPALVARLPVSDRYMSLEFKAKRFVGGMELSQELQHFKWMGYFDDAGLHRLMRVHAAMAPRTPLLQPVLSALPDVTATGLVDRIMHLDNLFFLPGNGLFQADRMTMANSLEARVPLLNRVLLELLHPLPAYAKMPGGSPKGLLRQVMTPHLPPAILNKPKKGFGPPTAHWLRGPLVPRFDAVFNRDKVMDQGVLNWGEVARLRDEHRQRRADHGRNLWALFSFQLWYDRFIAG